MDTANTRSTAEVEPRQWYLRDNERFLGTVMLAPAVIFIVLLVGIPFVMAILFSFSDVTVGQPEFDGFTLDSFRRVIEDPVFQRALANNFIFTGASQVIVLILANILAHVLTRPFVGRRLARVLIMLPWATPIAIGAIGWLWMLDAVYSPIDWLFRQWGLLGPHGILKQSNSMVWLGEPVTAMASIVLIHVWRMLPLSTVILMAGLTSIPQDVKDAVQVDGASWWLAWRSVTLPLLRPIIMVALLFGIIFTFTDMTVVHVLTRGGPVNSTQMLASWAYYQGIEGGNLAEGAATAIFLLPVLIGVAALMLRTASRSEVG
jgi:multiple sugar transport system permease protein